MKRIPLSPDVQLAGLRHRATDKGEVLRLRQGRGAQGIERLEASLKGQAFAPHRHDTYAIGMTLHGVQTFRYRGEQRYCLAGQGHVLHPDETHDGAAGTHSGFRYRILYIDPSLIQESLGGRALPFVANPVISRREMLPLFSRCLADIDGSMDELDQLEITVEVIRLLERHATVPRARRQPLALHRLTKVRDLIAQDPAARWSVRDFEQASGLDRWTIARGFRVAFGTSPTRFRTLRQLDKARCLMRAGMPTADAALEAGFADQSHLSRQFKRALGLTPSRWVRSIVEPIKGPRSR